MINLIITKAPRKGKRQPYYVYVGNDDVIECADMAQVEREVARLLYAEFLGEGLVEPVIDP